MVHFPNTRAVNVYATFRGSKNGTAVFCWGGGWRPWRTDKYCNCPPSRLFVFLHPVFMFTKVRHITIFPVSVYSFATWTQQCKNNIRQGALCLSLVKCTMVFMFPWFILRGLRWPRRLNRKRTWSEYPPLPTPRCHRDEKVEHPVHWCCLPAQKYTLRYFFLFSRYVISCPASKVPMENQASCNRCAGVSPPSGEINVHNSLCFKKGRIS